MLSFCMLSATMQILRSTHAKMQTTLSLALSLSATRIQPPSLADFMDVHCLTFTPPLLPVFFFSLPPFLPFSLLSLPSFVRHLFTLDQPCCDSWLQRATSFISHSSERGPFSAALKEREGTRSECIKKRGEWVYEKRARERKRIRSWPRGTSGVTKAEKGHTPTHLHTQTESLSALEHTLFLFFCFFVFVLLGVCRCCIHDPFLLFLSIRLLSISSFPHSFQLSRQYKGVSSPAPSRNPSLHLGVCVYECVFFFLFLSNLFYAAPTLQYF